ncbi:unnamed protein product [Malus baccata var. baccata]
MTCIYFVWAFCGCFPKESLLLSSNPNATGELVQVPGKLFQGSLLLGLISRATLGYAYVLPLPLYHYLTDSSLYVSYETSMQSFFN